MFLTHDYNENIFKEDSSINPDYNSFKKTGLIYLIFEDWWSFVYSKHKNQIDKCRANAPDSAKIKMLENRHLVLPFTTFTT